MEIDQHWLIVNKSEVQKCRETLELEKIYDKARKIANCPDRGKVLVPLLDSYKKSQIQILQLPYEITVQKEVILKAGGCQSPLDKLRYKVESDPELKHHFQSLPETFELYEDLLLLPSKSLVSYDGMLLTKLCDTFSVKRIARKSAVVNDKFRSPRTEMLLGEDPWACKQENGIKYNFNITKSMFCRGNISEKLRIAKFDCRGEVVVDLFAGIGYFVLPYLVHAKAAHVYACEWNPDSVEALKLNLEVAGVADRCTVLLGDNREVSPLGVADRVNLGLIPSSTLSWRTAVNALKSTGGVLHIHANVETKPGEEKRRAWTKWSNQTKCDIHSLLEERSQRTGQTADWRVDILHVEKVKSYGPKIYHLVLDLKCSIQERK